MNERPEQPPEGRLIAAATERSGLSIREASKRAGISYGRWRQVTSGVQHVSPGNFASVHAPARTLAKMAAAVGVTPEQLETEGRRPDAAGILREMRQHKPDAPAGAAPESPHDLTWEPEPVPGTIFDEESIRASRPTARLILRRLAEVRRSGITEPSGWDMYPDDWGMALGWEKDREVEPDPVKNAWMLARALVAIEQADQAAEQNRGRSGRGALVRT